MRKWRFKTLSNALDGWMGKVAKQSAIGSCLQGLVDDGKTRLWQQCTLVGLNTQLSEKKTELKFQGFCIS